MYLFRSLPNGISTTLPVLCSSNTTHETQYPSNMHYKARRYFQTIMKLMTTFMTTSIKLMLMIYTCIMITLMDNLTTCLHKPKTKANDASDSSVPPKKIPMMRVIGDLLDESPQIMLKLYSELPPNWGPIFFFYHFRGISIPIFLSQISQDSLFNTPPIPYFPPPRGLERTGLSMLSVERNTTLGISIACKHISRVARI